MFKILDEACTPTRATKYSAMVDLYARESVVIGAGETKIVPLGVKINFEIFWNNHSDTNLFDKDDERKEKFKENFLKKHYLELHPRSSLRAKGLIIGVGVIDLDFTDEIGLIVHNPLTLNMFGYAQHEIQAVDFAPENYTINKGDKVSQCTLKEHKGYLLGIESDTERSGGFGSTGM